MPAGDPQALEAVKKRVEDEGYSGFALWGGKAFLKNADRSLSEKDIHFKGEQDAVELYSYEAKGLHAEDVEYVAILKKMGDRPVGIVVRSWPFTVSNVEHSSVAEWNKVRPELQARAGDVVMEVNKATDR